MSRTERIDRHLRDLVSRRLLERAAELVSEGRVFRRVRNGELLQASVLTDDRLLRSEVEVGHYRFVPRCDCDSPRRFCEHTVAVAMAYVGDEESFFDLEAFLDDLAAFRKPDLVRMLRAILGRDPESLNALGLPGFEEPVVDPDEDSDFDPTSLFPESGADALPSDEDLLAGFGPLGTRFDDDKHRPN